MAACFGAVALGLLLAPPHAAAQSAERARAGGDDEADEEVTVRGRQTSGFVSRARIEDSPRTITDAASLIEPLPGVHVRRLGADDSFATLSIRGSSSTQVAVYLAGVPLSGGADPTLDLATLPLWPGARASVHRTFAKAALGRGSLGGTLVIDPPSARSEPRTEIWMAAGSFGSRRLRMGDVRGDPDGVRVATGLSASRSDDDFSYVDFQSSLAANREVLATRQNAGHAAAAGMASIAIPIRLSKTERGALTITNLAQARKQELPGSINYPTPLQRLDSTRLVSALELSLPAGSGSYIARGWARREGLQLRDSLAAFFVPARTDDAIIALGASTGWRGRPSEQTTLEMRIDGSAERYAPGTWVDAISPPGARRTNGGLAIDAGLRPHAMIDLAASGRIDTWFDSSDDGASANETRPTGNVGVEIPVGPARFASHAGFVARPPSFVERYGNRGAFIGDPNLRTESAFTTDLGARISKRGTRGVWKKITITAEAAGFASWAEDLITFVYVGAQGQAKATNIGRARLLGLEESLRASGYGFDLRLSHTALTTANAGAGACEFETTPGVCTRPALPGRPAHDVVGDLSWGAGPIRLRYGVDYVSGIVINSTTNAEVPARMLHGASIRLALPREPDLSLTFDIRNLLDLRAAEYPGTLAGTRTFAPIGDLFDYPLPGRRIMLSLQYVQHRSSSSREAN